MTALVSFQVLLGDYLKNKRIKIWEYGWGSAIMYLALTIVCLIPTWITIADIANSLRAIWVIFTAMLMQSVTYPYAYAIELVAYFILLELQAKENKRAYIKFERMT